MRYIEGVYNGTTKVSSSTASVPNFNYKYMVYDTENKEIIELGCEELSEDIIGVRKYGSSYVITTFDDISAKFESLLKFRCWKYSSSMGLLGYDLVLFHNAEYGVLFFNDNINHDYRCSFSIGDLVEKKIMDAIGVYNFNDNLVIDLDSRTVSFVISNREFVYDITDINKFKVLVAKIKMLQSKKSA